MTELICNIEKEFLSDIKIANKNIISKDMKKTTAKNCWDKDIEK